MAVSNNGITHDNACVSDVVSILYSHTYNNTNSPHLRRKWKHFFTKHNNSAIKATVQTETQAWMAMATI